jgi:hypothetical protein
MGECPSNEAQTNQRATEAWISVEIMVMGLIFVEFMESVSRRLILLLIILFGFVFAYVRFNINPQGPPWMIN